jgi:glycosyltransferase involved in cell wall biosynthesis
VSKKPINKRILFISPQPFFQWRGSPIRVGFNVRALAESGYQVDLLTLPFGEEVDIPGVSIVRVPNIGKFNNIPIGPSFPKAVFDLVLIFFGLRMAIKNRYDVIHGIEEAGAIARLIARITGSRYIYEKHSDPSSYKKGWLRNRLMDAYHWVEKFAARGANAVICTGQGLVEQAAKMAPGRPVYHIFDIPSSLVEVDREVSSSLRIQLSTHKDEILITYVGSFAVYQGVDLLFESIPLVVKKNQKARFVIIGGTTEEIKARQKQLKEQEVTDEVLFLGKIPPDELPGYLSASDILLVPRLAGVNTPLKVLDYFKAGGAIIATDVPGNRLILDDESALFADPNPKGFATAVEKLINRPEMIERLSQKGRLLYEKKYNFTQFKQRLSECYLSLWNNK